MARFTQNWYVSIVQGKNNANSTGAIFSKVPVMPWIHHRLHPVLVRIFLRLGLSKTLKEERVFSPGENVLTTWSSLLEAWLLVRSAQQKETVLQLRFPHLVIWRPVTWISSPDGPSRTLLSDHKCRSRLCSAEYFGGTRQARQSNQRTAASSVWTCQSLWSSGRLLFIAIE